jgi:cell division protein FtsW
VLVLIPGIGDERNGAQRWLEIGGFSFQPSEFAKFAVILLLAVKLSDNREHARSFFKGFLPPMFITLVFAALVLVEKDLGTPAVICATAFIMLFVAGTRRRFLFPGVVGAVAAIWALSVTSPHRLARLTAFLDPWSHRDTSGYQLIQSLAAITRGAVWGRGPGAGEQKLLYLPEAHTDFIFAVWAEEMGLVGSLVLLALFFALICVSLRIAFHANDLFGALLVSGITALVGLQAAVNMAVVSGMLPTKGLPLPFISWGGSSLIVFMGLMGIVVSVGLRAHRLEDRAARAPRAVPASRARAA